MNTIRISVTYARHLLWISNYRYPSKPYSIETIFKDPIFAKIIFVLVEERE